MDDSAHRKPPGSPKLGAAGLVGELDREAATHEEPKPTRFRGSLESLNQAQCETSGFATDERILRSYVHALERLYPETRFAMRLPPPQAAGTNRPSFKPRRTTFELEAMDEVSITEAGLLRAGFTCSRRGSPTWDDVTPNVRGHLARRSRPKNHCRLTASTRRSVARRRGNRRSSRPSSTEDLSSLRDWKMRCCSPRLRRAQRSKAGGFEGNRSTSGTTSKSC